MPGPSSRTSPGSVTASASPSRPALPATFTEPVDDPLADLVARYARTHGPFTDRQVAERLGLGAAVVRHTLQRLEAQGRVLTGEFRPTGVGDEWCDAEVLRRLRRRSLAKLRHEIEPVEPMALATVLGGVAAGLGGLDQRQRPRAARHRRRAARGRAAGRRAGAGVGARAAGAGLAGARLRTRLPRRAERRRRGGVGRPRRTAGQRRLGVAAPRRPGATHAARPAVPTSTTSCSVRC